jgi:hypothetical protein
MDSIVVASDSTARQNPNIELAYIIYQAEQCQKRGESIEVMKNRILEEIKKDSMSVLYAQVCESFKWAKDAGLFSDMEAANATILNELDQKLKDATENAGDTEVSISFASLVLYSEDT